MSNIAEYSVSEFSKAIKFLVEDAFGYVKIKGEISGLKKAASGHLYFSLKDDNDILSAICFKDMAELINFEIEDGLEVIAFGKVTTYGARSSYQIIVEKVQIAGVGAIMAMLEKRKKKLEEKGIFDDIHKIEIPYFPKRIGVITSASGAVIKDILHRVEDRCPTEILIYNVAVQGKKSAQEVIKAIKFFNKKNIKNKVDLLIIARGGGSIEDLLPFSDEDLVMSAFNSKIPIISAIGHETDFSLLDFVADLRAPTPTAAAEMATVIFDDLVDQIEYLNKRLILSKDLIISQFERRVETLAKYLKNPKESLLQIEKYLNDLVKNIEFNKNIVLERKKERIFNINLAKNDILNEVSAKSRQITYLSEILLMKSQNIINKNYEKIEFLQDLIFAKDYRNILKRGFAMIKDKDSKLISSIKNIKLKEELTIEMFDGEIEAYIFDKRTKNNQKKQKSAETIQPKLI